MKYDTVLELCLALVRRGEDPSRLIEEHPQYADRLRSDLAAAAALRGVTSALPPPADARQRLRVSLAAQRQARERYSFRLPRLLPLQAMASAVAVAVVIILVSLIFLQPSDTAEAAIEGVVIENNGSILTVQTASGVRSIAVANGATVSGETGAPVELASLEPGQLLFARGRINSNRIEASRIDVRRTEDLPIWCERFAEPCVQLEKEITQRAAECQRDAGVCQRLRARQQAIREGIAFAERLISLRNRCDAGVEAACSEVRQVCAERRFACGSIADWLRRSAPPR